MSPLINDTDIPRLSISTCFNYGLHLDKQLGMISKAGFSHVSFGTESDIAGYLSQSRCSELSELLEVNNLKPDTIHGDMLLSPKAFESTKNLISVANKLGVRCIVAHGSPSNFKAGLLQSNLKNLLEICNELLPVLRDNGIKIALENVMPGHATELIELSLSNLDPDYFGLCYDSSHDQIDGPRPFDLLNRFAGRIFAVHLSDRIAPFKDHVLPGEGFINWQEMCSILRDVHYNGSIMLEVMMNHSSFNDPVLFLEEAYAAASRIWDLIYGDSPDLS